jgi:hypothetical protein
MKISFIKAIGIIMIIIGLLILLFFKQYSGVLIPHPVVGFVLGLLLMISGYLTFKKGSAQWYEKNEENIKARIQEFRRKADKVRVDLNACEIKTNSYSEQVDKVKNYKAKAFDTLYDSDKGIENINSNETVLIFETEKYGEKEHYYSPVIYKDEITLRFMLDKQKETYIYIDKENRGNYYFDLEFLDD